MSKQPWTARTKFLVNPQFLSPLMIGTSILILGFLAYANTFHADFHYDDHTSILNPKSVQEYLDIPFLWQMERGRFFLYLTFAFNYRIGQFDPFSYHVVNWIIHILSAAGVFFLLKLVLTQQENKTGSFDKNKVIWMAWAGALFFLLHPLQTQAVTYVIQRTASLAALFYVLAILFYGLGRKENPQTRRWYVLSGVCTLLALFTKQNTYSLPAAFLAYEGCLIPASERSSKKRKGFLLALGGLFSLPVIAFFLVQYHPESPGGILAATVDVAAKMTRWKYFLTQQSVVAHYLRLVILPIGQNVDYDWPIAKSFFELRTLLGSFVLLIFLAAGIICFRKGFRAAAFGIFLFFIALSIESSIIPIADVIYEHRMYLPMAGLSLLFAIVLKNLAERFGHAMLLVFLMTGALGLTTYQRNKVWATEGSLWADVLKKSPNNSRALVNVAAEKGNRGEIDAMLPLYQKALEIDPNNSIALLNRGLVYQTQKSWELSLKDFLRLIEAAPENILGYMQTGYTYLQMGDYPKAEKYLKQTIQKNPDYHGGYYRLADLYKRTGRFDEAIPLLLKTIDLVSGQQKKVGHIDHLPALKDAAMWLAGIYYGKQNYALAIRSFDMATNADPDWGLAYYGKALAYGHQGNSEKVMDQIKELTRLRQQDLLDNLRKVIKLHKGTAPGEAASIEVNEQAAQPQT